MKALFVTAQHWTFTGTTKTQNLDTGSYTKFFQDDDMAKLALLEKQDVLKQDWSKFEFEEECFHFVCQTV